jgi:limonene-1,2-epoxide hydrolase
MKDAAMTPKDLVVEWVERFNARDATGLARLYHADAINHQVTQEPVIGRHNICTMFEREFSSAKMECNIEALHDAGNVIALEWSDPNGLRGCGFFTIQEGKIVFQRGYWDKLSFLKLHGLPLE